jgi:hypothetical protein
MNANQLPALWRLYSTNEDKCTALWLRLRERATDTRHYEHSHNTDARTLRIMDEAGEAMLRRIVAAGGGDPDELVAMVDDRFSDDEPQF